MADLLSLFVFLTPFFPSVAAASSSPEGVVGVIYSLSPSGLPPPVQVAKALVNAGVPRVLLIDPYPEAVAAFNHTGIPITIALNNSYIPALAKNEAESLRWLSDSILHPNINVEAVSLGCSVLTARPDLADLLIPALKNLHHALSPMGIKIPVSTSNSYDLVGAGFPPSEAEFDKLLVATYVKPLLAFLNATRSPFFTDAFPFRLYQSGAVQLTNSEVVNFGADEGRYLTDDKTGLTYSNLFDAMVDAVVTAMTKLGYDDIPVVVSGTGWPSAGGANDREATILFAAEYNERLVVKLNMGEGTPLRPGRTPLTYIYRLFDQPRNNGEDTELSWGIWTPDLEQKYMIDFTPAISGVGDRGLLGEVLLFAGGIVSYVVPLLVLL